MALAGGVAFGFAAVAVSCVGVAASMGAVIGAMEAIFGSPFQWVDVYPI